jgi:hypothetical protein
MGETFYFGGSGVHGSSMHPIVVVATLIAIIAMITLPRKYALSPALILVFLTPAPQLVLGGFHFTVVRLIILGGLVRLIRDAISRKGKVWSYGIQPIDTLLVALVVLQALAFSLRFKDIGAAIYQSGLLLDACLFIVCRHLIRDYKDLIHITKIMAVVAVLLAGTMTFEYMTRNNIFSYISAVPIVPDLRNGAARAQGTFSNSITAGTFGAVLFPMFFWLWKDRHSRALGCLGMVASVIISYTAQSSTGISALMGAVLGLGLWSVRHYMRQMRWAIVVVIVVLTLSMKVPIWFLMGRIDISGGHGWDRAELIDVTVHHFSEWWLLGTQANASWGADTWDACNEFVFQATAGGIGCLILFVALLSRGFGMLGRARRRASNYSREWFAWCFGAALFANFVGFWGIDYFDQVREWWYVFLAMIPAVYFCANAQPQVRERVVAKMWASPFVLDLGLSASSDSRGIPALEADNES